MVKMTQSFSAWCWKFHRDIYALLSFGHTELLTDEMWMDYLDWCRTDEGKQYLEEEKPNET